MLNSRLLMSGADLFSVVELNPYSHQNNQPDKNLAKAEYQAVKDGFEQAGVEIISVGSPAQCQDGIYTANWALCRGQKAILSSLPNARQAEQPYAREELKKLGYKLIEPPFRFSGQGDALPCGDLLFAGQTYRTDSRMHDFVAEQLGFEVIRLEAIPALDDQGSPIINSVSGWPDSFFYDIDLAISILREDLIAWCPEAFTPESQDKLAALDIGKIEVDYSEAVEGFACNLVSTGKTVIMSDQAPKLQSAIESKGLTTITPKIRELSKGGGYIRCTSLSLLN